MNARRYGKYWKGGKVKVQIGMKKGKWITRYLNLNSGRTQYITGRASRGDYPRKSNDS